MMCTETRLIQKWKPQTIQHGAVVLAVEIRIWCCLRQRIAVVSKVALSKHVDEYLKKIARQLRFYFVTIQSDQWLRL